MQYLWIQDNRYKCQKQNNDFVIVAFDARISKKCCMIANEYQSHIIKKFWMSCDNKKGVSFAADSFFISSPSWTQTSDKRPNNLI